MAVSALCIPTSRSPVCAFESHVDVAAFSRATAEIYYIKEGGRDEQIEAGKCLRGRQIKLRVGKVKELKRCAVKLCSAQLRAQFAGELLDADNG